MGAHHSNGVARAAAEGRPIHQLNAIGIGGDDLMSVEAKLSCSVDVDTGEIVIVVSAMVGRKSALTGFRGGPMVLGEFARMPLTTVKQTIATMMGDEPEVAQ